jgi:hypothetical protein
MREIGELELSGYIKDLDVYGFCQISNGLSRDLIDELKDKVEKNYKRIQSHESLGLRKRDSTDKMVYNLQSKDPLFIDILVFDPIKKILMNKLNDKYYRFLDESLPNYILSYYNARSSGEELPLHIDSHIPSLGDLTWTMQVVFLLEDMDEKNGCTTVVPGSHRSGKFSDRQLTNVTKIEAKAGDVIIWDSRLWHGTTCNSSGLSRWALVATFNRWWLKQSMNMTKSLPNEVYQQISDEQKLLLGFCSIPPSDETDRISIKQCYEDLLENVSDYNT